MGTKRSFSFLTLIIPFSFLCTIAQNLLSPKEDAFGKKEAKMPQKTTRVHKLLSLCACVLKVGKKETKKMDRKAMNYQLLDRISFALELPLLTPNHVIPQIPLKSIHTDTHSPTLPIHQFIPWSSSHFILRPFQPMYKKVHLIHSKKEQNIQFIEWTMRVVRRVIKKTNLYLCVREGCQFSHILWL